MEFPDCPRRQRRILYQLIRFIYNSGIHIYTLAIHIAAAWNQKARLWVNGRVKWKEKLRSALPPGTRSIWMHVSSLGEYEQGKPVLEKVRELFPEHRTVLSFFSPSGFEIRKDDEVADVICYLPADTPANGRHWSDIVRPEICIFVKYDLWANHIFAARKAGSRLLLISALLTEESRFLRGIPARLYRRVFDSFDIIFTQDESTSALLRKKLRSAEIVVAGDTRFDRVARLPENAAEVPGIREWIGGRFCIVAGSTYPDDDEILFYTREIDKNGRFCWIVAPHNIDRDAISSAANNDSKMAVFSSGIPGSGFTNWLWVDNVGMLSRLYRYADLVHVGGGFGENVHNTQEPAAFGKVLTFGPNYQRFIEATDLVKIGCAFPVRDKYHYQEVFERLVRDEGKRTSANQLSASYIRSKSGATDLIMKYLVSSQR